jgi:hypothetical protein
MDAIKDIWEIVEKLLGVPYYYTEAEEALSVGSSILAAIIGFFVVRRFVQQTRNRSIFSAGALVVVFVLYYTLKDVGGIFFIQTACRIALLLLITFLIPYTNEEGNAE